MTDDTKTPEPKQDPRQDRLKAALRENLKRRKVQARERAARGENVPEDDVAQGETIAGKSAG